MKPPASFGRERPLCSFAGGCDCECFQRDALCAGHRAQAIRGMELRPIHRTATQWEPSRLRDPGAVVPYVDWLSVLLGEERRVRRSSETRAS